MNDNDTDETQIDDMADSEQVILKAILPVIAGMDVRVVVAALFGLTAAFSRSINIPPEMYSAMATGMASYYDDISTNLPDWVREQQNDA
jgi:hypothetical protein